MRRAEEQPLCNEFIGLDGRSAKALASQLYYGQPFIAEQNALLDRTATRSLGYVSTELTWAASEQGLGGHPNQLLIRT